MSVSRTLSGVTLKLGVGVVSFKVIGNGGVR